jgi:hypothetical protein
MEPTVEPRAFTVGVLAPAGFDLPDLRHKLWSRLYPLIAPRLSKREAVRFHGVFGEPVSQALGEISREKGWGSVPGYCGRCERGQRIEHRSACAEVVLAADAVVLVSGGRMDRDLTAVRWWCNWLGVPVRVVEVGADAVTPRPESQPRRG